jgi:hypothetical protein
VSKERFPQFQADAADDVGSKVSVHGKLEYSPHPADGNVARWLKAWQGNFSRKRKNIISN